MQMRDKIEAEHKAAQAEAGRTIRQQVRRTGAALCLNHARGAPR
jgi:hypothetical protein